ncbi:hypothetical protein OG2516_10406 [Oceanicola granulosus HTCC2516]|uniref:CENP-V/GFA domain-containing protein n=1 Tax=Oceanicola granulosus (strain ATCC BAA-861 / DSM 15982 / KCTC 12143 / HTCC2516) TaxID=314256 RepID=Q2CKC2_OCEGH|nr:GFA family protein [Oceanicola granulosus]EAR52867.1 hypothetical protein OG2516_10406 [Oceanicola granulosus HTCC2516]
MAEAAKIPARLEGRCLCGAVALVVEGRHDGTVGVCHCSMCQRWSGGLFACFRAEAAAVSVTGEVRRHRSSEIAERAFCPACGSHLWMRDTAGDAPYDLMPGLFPALAAAPLGSEIYTDKAPAYLPLSGNHTRETEAEWQSRNSFVQGDTP